MKKIVYFILFLLPCVIILLVLSSITTGNDRIYTGIDIKVYKNTDSGIVLVQDAFVRVKGVNNSYCETCYTSYSGKCRKQINQAGYYSFCASKDNYEDGKTVYVSGGTMEVYLYLDNYGSCEPCLYPEGKEK